MRRTTVVYLSSPTATTLKNVECALNKISEQLSDTAEKFVNVFQRIDSFELSLSKIDQNKACINSPYLEELNIAEDTNYARNAICS